MRFLSSKLICLLICGVIFGQSIWPDVSVADQPNVLLILVDDLRPELGCYGAEHIHSPNIDALAKRGCMFQRHYVQAPTCGASRYALLTGQYGPYGNDALFQRAARQISGEVVPPSMPEWFRQHGYTTVSVGKVSHHPGGRGGPNWDDDEKLEMPHAWDRHLQPSGPWLHPRGIMHGLANGAIRSAAGDMAVFEAVPGDDSIYPDGLITDEALLQIDQLAGETDKPFFLAVGLIRPHLPFGAPEKYLDLYRDVEFPPISHPHKPEGRTTWHRSGEFMSYQRWNRDPNSDELFADQIRKHYAACISYSDALIGKLIDRLHERGLADNTVLVLWGDHGWHLGEHAIWGKHSLFEESLRAPLIICEPNSKHAGITSESITETIDLFPTLCELVALPIPDFVQGHSLVSNIRNLETPDRVAISYLQRARTIRSSSHRLIVHNDGYCELYDHRSPEAETGNIATSYPDFVASLKQKLDDRLPPRDD
ncbi:MAG: sulfatase [Pirellulaceae bacterium]|nr:sulfatase [Pirellulaceae bacterium]